MPERRVTEIVGKRDGFGEILIEAQLARHGACDLRHLERVRQARAVVVALVEDEHLRLVGEPPEGGRMQDAVAVALEGAARRALGLRVEAPAARHGARRIGRRASARRGARLRADSRRPSFSLAAVPWADSGSCRSLAAFEFGALRAYLA